MVDWRDWPSARAAIADLSTSAEHLADIAAVQPGLWPAIAAHPNAYPALLDWLDSHGDPEVSQAVQVRRFANVMVNDAGRQNPSDALEFPSVPSELASFDSSAPTVLAPTTVQDAPQEVFRTTPLTTPLASVDSAADDDDVAATKLATSYPHEPDPNAPNSRRTLIIGLIVGLAVLLLVGVGLGYYFIHQRPLSSAQQTYNTSVTGFKNAQDILRQSVELGNRVVATGSVLIPDDAREALISSILATRPLLEGPSGEPTVAQQLLDAATELDSRANQIRDTEAELQTMINSLVDRVVSALEDIVPIGQKVYEASDGLLGEDDKTRPRLKNALDTTCTQSDAANKVICLDRVLTDILTQARGVLAPILEEARRIYDSSEDQLTNEAPRVALNNALGKATCDQDSPEEVLSCIRAALEAVPAAQKTLDNSLRSQTFEYVITGPNCGQMGVNCGYPTNGTVTSIEGWNAFASAALVWMEVSVTGDEVAVAVCATQGILQDVKKCIMNGQDSSWAWSGTRKGREAIITPKVMTGPGYAFMWATVTFAGPESASRVTGVVFPQVCEKIDGSFGKNVEDAEGGPFHCE